ncbi:transcription repressor NadR [Fictibacillus aquaticus]|uniref:Transcription repressor NadR n=1 Tax=Fictibacillus aquaticus TaxID=2021314 RepID=A0A235F9Q7_9BACL|nr:transcription repressor NadR [Fictibacillus aquaticus]OYD58056.1 transcription repressor NadR [Fictibacillus aquaticus]
MKSDEKIKGSDRRELILQWLKENSQPLKGSWLAKKTNVSRQVIVQDISLLKAANEPIMATAQGYVYMQAEEKQEHCAVVASRHSPEETEDELNTMVDHGVLIRDVIVDHPVYGHLTASLMLSNRNEVRNFIKKLQDTKASLLSELTEGVHLHTLSADSTAKLNSAIEALRQKGYILS